MTFIAKFQMQAGYSIKLAVASVLKESLEESSKKAFPELEKEIISIAEQNISKAKESIERQAKAFHLRESSPVVQEMLEDLKEDVEKAKTALILQFSQNVKKDDGKELSHLIKV